MFTELPKTVFVHLKPYLQSQNIPYEVSDCTPADMQGILLHITFPDVSADIRNSINQAIDKAYEQTETEQVLAYRKDQTSKTDLSEREETTYEQ